MEAEMLQCIEKSLSPIDLYNAGREDSIWAQTGKSVASGHKLR
jgi:hypothetical protein